MLFVLYYWYQLAVHIFADLRRQQPKERSGRHRPARVNLLSVPWAPMAMLPIAPMAPMAEMPPMVRDVRSGAVLDLCNCTNSAVAVVPAGSPRGTGHERGSGHAKPGPSRRTGGTVGRGWTRRVGPDTGDSCCCRWNTALGWDIMDNTSCGTMPDGKRLYVGFTGRGTGGSCTRGSSGASSTS